MFSFTIFYALRIFSAPNSRLFSQLLTENGRKDQRSREKNRNMARWPNFDLNLKDSPSNFHPPNNFLQIHFTELILFAFSKIIRI
jgi:hypothetical protein